GGDTALEPLGRAEALIELVENTYKFNVQERAALDVLAEVVRPAACYRLTNGSLDAAGAAVTGPIATPPPEPAHPLAARRAPAAQSQGGDERPMCGIAGVIDPAGTRSPDALADIARRMAATLRHRGPDDDGVWTDHSGGIALGFRRLAVVDTGATGSQPMR